MNSFIEKIKIVMRPMVYSFRTFVRLIFALIYPSKITNAKQIPIIINNRNRYEYLIQLIASLEKRGYTNIYIIDNDSSYPPLLDYYNNCKYEIFRLGENVGLITILIFSMNEFMI